MRSPRPLRVSYEEYPERHRLPRFTLGIRALPASVRRNELEAYRRGLLNGGLEIVPFDERAADWMASERAREERFYTKNFETQPIQTVTHYI